MYWVGEPEYPYPPPHPPHLPHLAPLLTDLGWGKATLCDAVTSIEHCVTQEAGAAVKDLVSDCQQSIVNVSKYTCFKWCNQMEKIKHHSLSRIITYSKFHFDPRFSITVYICQRWCLQKVEWLKTNRRKAFLCLYCWMRQNCSCDARCKFITNLSQLLAERASILFATIP